MKKINGEKKARDRKLAVMSMVLVLGLATAGFAAQSSYAGEATPGEADSVKATKQLQKGACLAGEKSGKPVKVQNRNGQGGDGNANGCDGGGQGYGPGDGSCDGSGVCDGTGKGYGPGDGSCDGSGVCDGTGKGYGSGDKGKKAGQ